MKTKTKALSRGATLSQEALPAADWPASSWTLKDRLQRIDAMGQRLNGSIRFICKSKA
ncbi:MAG TPA: hypothetical protein VKU02_11580 [Gemmataceae bacterium]|nr:hypothetical protein [Gemmataceae bacterium]